MKKLWQRLVAEAGDWYSSTAGTWCTFVGAALALVTMFTMLVPPHGAPPWAPLGALIRGMNICLLSGCVGFVAFAIMVTDWRVGSWWDRYRTVLPELGSIQGPWPDRLWSLSYRLKGEYQPETVNRCCYLGRIAWLPFRIAGMWLVAVALPSVSLVVILIGATLLSFSTAAFLLNRVFGLIMTPDERAVLIIWTAFLLPAAIFLVFVVAGLLRRHVLEPIWDEVLGPSWHSLVVRPYRRWLKPWLCPEIRPQVTFRDSTTIEEERPDGC
ncbi:hypothetical protein HY375_00260 [Candidatus Berkelbacteria bacterium]|nr:hypothetical protein [Candidatus Berkelbacteria bacterium]